MYNLRITIVSLFFHISQTMGRIELFLLDDVVRLDKEMYLRREIKNTRLTPHPYEEIRLENILT